MRSQSAIWTAAAVLAAVAALSFWYGLKHAGQRGLAVPPRTERSADSPGPGRDRAAPVDGGVALRYAVAVHQNNCEEVLRMLWWVQERLALLAERGAGEVELDKERERLCEELLDRSVADNRLAEEGVGDAYLFVPGAKIRAVSADDGASGLAKPVRRRVWLRVTYPVLDRALRDSEGRAIRSLLAGVNVSADGFVLKAGVEGTVEIDRRSLTYAWPNGIK